MVPLESRNFQVGLMHPFCTPLNVIISPYNCHSVCWVQLRCRLQPSLCNLNTEDRLYAISTEYTMRYSVKLNQMFVPHERSLLNAPHPIQEPTDSNLRLLTCFVSMLVVPYVIQLWKRAFAYFAKYVKTFPCNLLPMCSGYPHSHWHEYIKSNNLICF